MDKSPEYWSVDLDESFKSLEDDEHSESMAIADSSWMTMGSVSQDLFGGSLSPSVQSDVYILPGTPSEASGPSNYSSWNQLISESQKTYAYFEPVVQGPVDNVGFVSEALGSQDVKLDEFTKSEDSVSLLDLDAQTSGDFDREQLRIDENTQDSWALFQKDGSNSANLKNAGGDSEEANRSIDNFEDDEMEFDTNVAGDREVPCHDTERSKWNLEDDWDWELSPIAKLPEKNHKKPVLETSHNSTVEWNYEDLNPTEARTLILTRVEALMTKLTADVMQLRYPVLTRLYQTPDGRLVETAVNFHNLSSRYKFTVLVKVLSKIYQLLKQKSIITRRDFYYEYATFFENQDTVDSAIMEAAMILRVDPRHLPFQSSTKGRMAAGENVFLRHVEQGQETTIPVSLEGSSVPQISTILKWGKLISNAKFVVILEKDTVFHRLCNEQIFDYLDPCILVTGKGYPDKATQTLVHKLNSDLRIPVFAIVDSDPHGFEIAATYRWGSLAYSKIPGANAKITVPELVLLGVMPSEIERYGILEDCKIPLTDRDYLKIQRLEKRFNSQNDPIWSEELAIMAKSEYKAEIEALAAMGPKFLTRIYMPAKINELFRQIEDAKNAEQILPAWDAGLQSQFT